MSSSASNENLVVTTPTLAFGTQNDGTASGIQQAFVKSTGTAPVTISSYTFTGTNAADFMKQSQSRTECYQDLQWALINSKEFLFVH